MLNRLLPRHARFAYLFLVVWIIFRPATADAQTKVQQKIPDKTRVLFLLDGSGSMMEPWGRATQIKMNMAKSILSRIIDSLQRNNRLELALRVYGHRYPKEVNNCKDTWLEVPFKPNNHKQIIAKINEIKPKGVTPITYSLEQAAKDFPPGPGYRNIIILITDGIESCSGDPCATSRELQKKGIFLRPYIIGLGLQAEKSLDCVGKFIDAKTPQELHRILDEAIETSFAKTTVSVELLNGNGQPTESNVNVTFINSFTNLPMYDFIHYRDKTGRTDTVQVDPLVDYDVVVNTVPPIYKRNVQLVHGRHNTITIPAGQGTLVMTQDGRKDNNLLALVREKGKTNLLNTQRSQERFRYLAGQYEVDVLSLPRRNFSISLAADKTQTISLPAPGVVNFNTTTVGYGSLYELSEDGTQTWVCNLNDQKPQFPLTLLPGRYKFVFRTRNAPGSKYTAFKVFTVKSGETVLVKMFD